VLTHGPRYRVKVLTHRPAYARCWRTGQLIPSRCRRIPSRTPAAIRGAGQPSRPGASWAERLSSVLPRRSAAIGVGTEQRPT